jgi:hypothetical protein
LVLTWISSLLFPTFKLYFPIMDLISSLCHYCSNLLHGTGLVPFRPPPQRKASFKYDLPFLRTFPMLLGYYPIFLRALVHMHVKVSSPADPTWIWVSFQ